MAETKGEVPVAEWCAVGSASLQYVAVSVFVITSLLFSGFSNKPTLVPDAFNFVAVSFAVFVLRWAWWKEARNYPPLVIPSILFSFFSICTCSTAFFVVANVTVEQAYTGTIILNSKLNRTGLGTTDDVTANSPYWISLRGLYMVCVTIEMLYLVFTVFSIASGHCSCEKNKKKKKKKPLLLLEQPTTVEKKPRKLRLSYYSCILYWIGTAALPFFSILAVGVIICMLLYTWASSYESVPAWSSIESPHAILISPAVIVTFTTIGRKKPHKFWFYKHTWKKYGLILWHLTGLMISIWAVVLDKTRVEEAGATWVNYDSYYATIDCQPDTDLGAGFGYSCLSTIRGKVVQYSMAHHILGLLLITLAAGQFVSFALYLVMIVDQYPVSKEKEEEDEEEDEDLENDGS